jgi:putative FmdB family regulatory protein
MAVYDYLCARCGPFTEMRPMAESALPHECPGCGDDAPRAFLTAPYYSGMSSEARLAHATNERSASSPQTLSGMKRTHGSGCGCCSGTSMRYNKGAGRKSDRKSDRPAAKGFPSKRPWMISH